MSDQWYAIFNGATGDLVGTGTVLTPPLNLGLRAVTVDGDANGRFWDKSKLNWTTVQKTVPAAPVILAALPGDGQVSLTWTAPSDGGSPVTGYVVTPYANGVALPVTVVSTSTTGCVVSGLTNSTAHTFKVAAVNAVGTGAQSAASAAVTPTGGVVINPQGDPFPYKEEWVQASLIYTNLQTCATNIVFKEHFDVPPLVASIAVNYPGRSQYGAYLTFTTGNLTKDGVQICGLAPQKLNFTVPIVVHVVQRFREKA